jgi:hypothetical protein
VPEGATDFAVTSVFFVSFLSRIFPSDFFSDTGTEFLGDHYNSLVGRGLAKIGNFRDTPSPPLPIGIIELQAKTFKIFEFKGLTGKIFWNKELACLPANSTRPHWCPPQEINHWGLFSRVISSLSNY